MIFAFLSKCKPWKKVAMLFPPADKCQEKLEYTVKQPNGAADKTGEPPKDPFYLLYITFFMIGILLLLPFNFFTTANHYWMYKFRNTSLAETTVDDRTWWQIEFASVLIITSQTTSMFCNFLVTLLRFRLNTKIAVVFATSVMLLLFITVLGFIFVDTDPWQADFFIITMVIVAGINAMKSLINICIYDIISFFPSNYLISYLIGQGTAGVFAAVFQILSLAVGADSKLTAIIYFSSGISFVAITLLLFIFSLQTKYFKHHIKNSGITRRKEVLTYTEIFEIYKCMWTSAAIMGLVIFTLIAVYPAVASLVVSDGIGDGNKWNDLFFVPVTTYLLYCVSDVCGRVIAAKVKKKLSDPLLVLVTLFRFFLVVPAVMMCNARPRRNLPVLFPHDWQYTVIIISFGISSGYLANVAYINVENLVPQEKKTDAFSLLSASNGIVLFLASFMGQMCVQIL